MRTVVDDVRHGLRLLVRNPGFTTVAVLTLALGIGANTAIFSVANALLARPLPVSNPDLLVGLTRGDGAAPPASYPDFKDYRDGNQAFSGLAAYSPTPLSFGRGSASDIVLGEIVSEDYFSVLGISPALGQMFAPEGDWSPGTHPEAVISHGCWQNRLGGVATAVGQPLVLNGHTFTVIGVAPPGFRGASFPLEVDVWVPLSMQAQAMPGSSDLLADRRREWLGVVGRLKPHLGAGEAAAELNVLDQRLQADHPETYTQAARRERRELGLLHLRGIYLPHQRRLAAVASLLLLMVAGAVLLIACVNVANLLLARTAARQREIAVRIALGANRRRVVQQVLTENLVLTGLGAACGLLVAFLVTRLLVRFEPPIPAPWRFNADPSLNASVLGFAALLGVVTGVLIGLAPAVRFSKPSLVPALNAVGASPHGRKRIRMRKLLVVGQVALSLALLVCAALFLRSLRNAQTVDVGFETKNGLVMALDLGLQGYSQPSAQAFYAELAARLQALPGVRSVALTSFVPLGLMDVRMPVRIEGREPSPNEEPIVVGEIIVDPNYFSTLGIPMLRGRAFSSGDVGTAVPVVIVNETMARRFWPDEDPLGKRLHLGEANGPLREVVGVARDTKHTSLGTAPPAVVYAPFAQRYSSRMIVVVRTTAEPRELQSAVRQEVAALDPNIPVQDLRTLAEHADFSLWPARMGASLLSVFGALGLLLTALGIYGVVSYSVAQRTQEIGIRTALGAKPADILRMVMREGLRLTAAGVGLGLLGSLVLTRLLQSLLFGISSVEPVALVGGATVLGAVALGASYLPARRAARVDPLVALRYE